MKLPAALLHRAICCIATILVLVGSWPTDAAPFADADAELRTVPAFRQANQVGVLTVHGPVDQVTLASLERRVEQAVDDGADAIVIELDTPGGDMYATLDITHLIKTDCPANTVAWINNKAFSAGTIMALACREIVLAPNASFGDAAPIQAMPLVGLIQMEAAERAKLEAVLLAEVIDSARRNGYDENLVQSFVAVGVELWLIENKATGERVFVGADEYRVVFGEDPPAEFVNVTPPQSTASKVVDPVRAKYLKEIGQLDLDNPGDQQLEAGQQKDIDIQQVREPSRSALTKSDAGQWMLIGQVISSDRLLTLKNDEALHYGLAAETVANDAQLLAFFGAQSLKRYDANWSEGLVRFLRNPVVMGILIVIMLLGFFIEMAAPGMGIFGGAAAVALLLLVGAPTLMGLADWWTLAAIIAGLLLIAAELFVVPGLGLAGLLGAACLLVGLVGSFVTGDLSTAAGQADLWTGLATTIAALFAAGVGMWLISRQIHSLPLFDRLILKAEVTGERRGADDRLATPGPVRAGADVGDVGEARTDLRPAGRAMFEGRLLDVHSVGPYIAAGTPVRIVRRGEFEIIVEACES